MTPDSFHLPILDDNAAVRAQMEDGKSWLRSRSTVASQPPYVWSVPGCVGSEFGRPDAGGLIFACYLSPRDVAQTIMSAAGRKFTEDMVPKQRLT